MLRIRRVVRRHWAYRLGLLLSVKWTISGRPAKGTVERERRGTVRKVALKLTTGYILRAAKINLFIGDRKDIADELHHSLTESLFVWTLYYFFKLSLPSVIDRLVMLADAC